MKTRQPSRDEMIDMIIEHNHELKWFQEALAAFQTAQIRRTRIANRHRELMEEPGALPSLTTDRQNAINKLQRQAEIEIDEEDAAIRQGVSS